MSTRIFKYPLPSFNATIAMPSGSQVIHCGMQDGRITLWAIVDEFSVLEERRMFLVVGTGHEINEINNLAHVGTVFDGPYVWHVFEAKYP